MQEKKETLVQSWIWKAPLEEEMAAHSSILAWRIPWTEEPGGLQSRGRRESDVTERAQTTDGDIRGREEGGDWRAF